MEEHVLLKSYTNQYTDFTDEEFEEFASYFEPVFVKKRQFLTQPGFTASHRYFVANGAFRAYLICKDGHDHTIQIAIDDWWITDYNSYILQEKATLFVLALEDSKVLQISYEDEEKLKASNHKYETFFRKMAEKAVGGMQRRIIDNLTQNAATRYAQFINKYPEVAQRVPQYALASYLGMSTEYLSKLRNNRVGRK